MPAGRHRMRARRVHGRWRVVSSTPRPWWRRLLAVVLGLGEITASFSITAIALVVAVLIISGASS